MTGAALKTLLYLGLPYLLCLGLFIRWMVQTKRLNLKVLFSVQIVFLIGFILVPLWYLRILPGAEAYFERIFTKRVTGVAFNLPAPRAYSAPSEDSPAGINVFAYPLPADLVSSSFTPPPPHFRDHPFPPDRNPWQIITWTTGVPTTEIRTLAHLALHKKPLSPGEMGLALAPEGNPLLAEVQAAILTPHTHTAVLYIPDPAHPLGYTDIDVYVIDPEARVFYIVTRIF